MSKDATRVIECPSCGAAGSVPWAGARGFTSPGFEYDCARCGLVVNHDLLCAGKFFEALARAKNDPGFCLPNTAILVRGELDVSRCASIVAAVRKCLQDDKGGIPPLKDLAESAANEGSSTMAFIANKLSRADALRAERNSAPAVRPKYAHTPRLAVTPYSSMPSSIRILSLRTSSLRCVCGLVVLKAACSLHFARSCTTSAHSSTMYTSKAGLRHRPPCLPGFDDTEHSLH
ncbi:hypothetical protein PTI98_009098 [Pleurotus ostreatus]|nr:hypothetical protein PTI98_009098 [Pleurotus ostreatus]